MALRSRTCQWGGGVARLLLAIVLGACLGTVAAGPGCCAEQEMTLARPTAVWPIGPEVAAPQEKAFVRIQITNVHNPRRIPLSFAVRFRSKAGEESELGTFSLFPPDNPGTFLVATGGQLRRSGAIVVSLVPLEAVVEPEAVRVRVGRISLMGEGEADSALRHPPLCPGQR